MTSEGSYLPRAFGPVSLRRFRPTDLAAFQSYRQDPDVGRFQSWSPMTDERAAAFLHDVASAPLFDPGEWAQIAIAESETDGLIGDIGLCLSPDEATVEIGFTLAPAAQGRGLAFRAVSGAISLVFEASPANEVIGITDERNKPSVRLLRSLGMQHVETQIAEFRGENCTELSFETTRTGWSHTSKPV